MCRVLNKHAAGRRHGAIYIGRGSKWSNPFGSASTKQKASDFLRPGKLAQAGVQGADVLLTQIQRLSGFPFRVAWIEHAYEEGAAIPVERWSAILTVITQTPRTEERLRKNPLGIYFDAIAWSRELGGNE
jgi:type IV secretory pathway TrbF-like protein